MATLTVNPGSFIYDDLFDGLRDAGVLSSSATQVVYGYAGFSLSKMILKGTGLIFDASKKMTGGTVTEIGYSGFEGTPLWKMAGLTLSAAGLQTSVDAYRSSSSAASLQTLFAGQAWVASGSATGDNLVGGIRPDVLNGGLGDDTLVGGQGADVINGGPLTGDLRREADSGFDYDILDYSREGGAGAIKVDLTKVSGNVQDTFGAFDTVSGIELIVGTSKADTFLGSNGTQYEAFTGGAGADTINGGGGLHDEVHYGRETGSNGVTVNLASGVATDTFGNRDTLLNIERVRGTLRSDSLTGNGLDNVFTGLGGNDTIAGGAGNDTVRYDRDENYETGRAGVRVELQASTDANGTLGFARDGFGAVDTLTSIENVRGTNAADRILGTSGANVLTGDGGGDYLDGRAGNDSLAGGDGNDQLVGDLGNDTIDGGTAADLIAGGAGLDRLTGGSGTDTFVFATALGTTNVDTITDFVAADDTIHLENAVFTALAATGTLPAAAFKVGPAATDADDRIVYDTTTGALLYDADGSGATKAIQFAKVLPVDSIMPTLTAADFFIV